MFLIAAGLTVEPRFFTISAINMMTSIALFASVSGINMSNFLAESFCFIAKKLLYLIERPRRHPLIHLLERVGVRLILPPTSRVAALITNTC